MLDSPPLEKGGQGDFYGTPASEIPPTPLKKGGAERHSR